MKNTKTSYQKNALCLFLLLLVLAIICLLVLLRPADSSSLTALIYQNGELIKTIPLSSVKEPYTLTITGEGECTNVIEVRPGSIGIISADCPDRLCVHQGFISSPSLPVTCLPNRLVIQLTEEKAAKASQEPDITAY